MSTTTQFTIDQCLAEIRKLLDEARTYSVDFGFGITEKPWTGDEYERIDEVTITIKINQPPPKPRQQT